MSFENLLAGASDVNKVVTQTNPELPTQAPLEGPEEVNFGQTLVTAFELHNPITSLYQNMNTPYEELTRWTPSMDMNSEMYKGVDFEYIKEIQGARNEDHAYKIRDEIIAEQEANKQLTDQGWTGMGAIALASIMEPTILVGGGAIYNTGKLALKANRMKRFALLSGEGAATAALPTAVLAQNQHTVDAEDVFYNGLAGMAIVGGADLMIQGGSKLLGKGNDILEQTRKDMDAKQAAPRDLSAAAVDNRTTRFASTENEEDLIAETLEWQKQNKVQRGGKVSEVMDKISGAFGSKVKTDSTNLWESKSSVANKFTHEMAESGSGIYGRSDTAAQIKDYTERRYLSAFMPNYQGHVDAFGVEAGITGRKAKADAFNKELRLELENRRRAFLNGETPTPHSNARVNEAADEWQKMMDSVLDDAKGAGVKGFDEVERVPGYVPLHWDGRALAGMSRLDRNGYMSLLAEGYESVGIDDETAMKIAEAVFTRAERGELGLDSNVQGLLSGDAAVALRELLGEDEFDNIAKIVRGKQEDKGKAARARTRTDVDLTVTDTAGRSLLDIVNNDMQFVGSKYAQEMAGRNAMARKGIKSEADYNTIKEAALKQASEAGEDVEMIGKSMDSVYNQLLSRPADGIGVNKGVRRFMDFASVSMLGGMGMAQLAEYGPILAQIGLKDTFKNLPFLSPKNFSRQFEGDVLKDMQSLIGKVGQEEILYSPYVRLEDSGDAVTNSLLRKYDDISARATYLNGVLSGNNAIKRHQQRMAVTLGAAKLARIVKEGTETIDKKFLDELGIDDDLLNEVAKRIETGDITFNQNGGLDALNLANWDKAKAQKFAVAMNRNMHQVVQRTLAGEDSYWMHGSMAKMFLQFRNYPIAAMGKQLARGVRSGNAAPVFLYSTGMAALAYNLKLVVQGKDTSDLDIDDHVLGVMQMSSPAGLLPDMYSTTMAMMGQDTTFGRQADVSNPVFSLIESAAEAPQAVYNISSGNPTRSDISTLTALTPYSNIAGVSHIVNSVKDGL